MADKGGSGYKKIDTKTGAQSNLIDQLIQMVAPNFQAAAEGYKQFLPGGGGGEAIANAAQQRFQQQTVPSIMNSYGRGSKGSSSLNQALAGGAANLNSDVASQLAQMQLQAAGGLGNLGAQQMGGGLTDKFALAPKQQGFGQSALLGLLGLGGQLGGAYLGRPQTNFNWGG